MKEENELLPSDYRCEIVIGPVSRNDYHRGALHRRRRRRGRTNKKKTVLTAPAKSNTK
jgi:hypothetical protein